MGLQKYISELLYRHDCVIVPNFGGFVSNTVSARIDNQTHTFYAPSKQLTFNPQLQNNDGLLANHIAGVMNVSYDAAMNHITSQVKSWKNSLENSILELENIGAITKNLDNTLLFEPTQNVNYLTTSFGLASFTSPAVTRESLLDEAEKVIAMPVASALHTETISEGTEKPERKAPVFLRYAAAIALMATVGSFGWKTYQNQTEKQFLATQKLQQEAVEAKIQKATFEIPDTLPIISLNVVKEPKNYHIIAGAFREPQNATKKVNQLIAKGFDAQIIGTNKWNLTQVSFDSYATRSEALRSLRHIKRTVSKDAWLLVKEL